MANCRSITKRGPKASQKLFQHNAIKDRTEAGSIIPHTTAAHRAVVKARFALPNKYPRTRMMCVVMIMFYVVVCFLKEFLFRTFWSFISENTHSRTERIFYRILNLLQMVEVRGVEPRSRTHVLSKPYHPPHRCIRTILLLGSATTSDPLGSRTVNP